MADTWKGKATISDSVVQCTAQKDALTVSRGISGLSYDDLHIEPTIGIQDDPQGLECAEFRCKFKPF